MDKEARDLLIAAVLVLLMSATLAVFSPSLNKITGHATSGACSAVTGLPVSSDQTYAFTLSSYSGEVLLKQGEQEGMENILKESCDLLANPVPDDTGLSILATNQCPSICKNNLPVCKPTPVPAIFDARFTANFADLQPLREYRLVDTFLFFFEKWDWVQTGYTLTRFGPVTVTPTCYCHPAESTAVTSEDATVAAADEASSPVPFPGDQPASTPVD